MNRLHGFEKEKRSNRNRSVSASSAFSVAKFIRVFSGLLFPSLSYVRTHPPPSAFIERSRSCGFGLLPCDPIRHWIFGQRSGLARKFRLEHYCHIPGFTGFFEPCRKCRVLRLLFQVSTTASIRFGHSNGDPLAFLQSSIVNRKCVARPLGEADAWQCALVLTTEMD
jgi:hypothetical protein